MREIGAMTGSDLFPLPALLPRPKLRNITKAREGGLSGINPFRRGARHGEVRGTSSRDPTGVTKMRLRYLALSALPLLAACGSSVDPNAALETVKLTERSQIDAVRANDLRGATRVYEDKATLVSPGGTSVAGIDAISGEFKKLLADPNLKVEFTQGDGWASKGGDLAVTTGQGSMTTTDVASGKPVTTAFNYQTVWHKADGGPWKIVSDYDVAVPSAQVAAR
jgi:ketosteroid isomerase-like protein